MPRKGNKNKALKRASLVLFFCLFLPIYVYSAPVKIIKINDDGPCASSYSITLSIPIPESLGFSQTAFSNNSSTWSTQESYISSKSYTLSPAGYVTREERVSIGDALFIAQYLVNKRDAPVIAAQERTLYVKFIDKAANTAKYSDSITLNTIAPKLTTLTPANLSRYYQDKPILIQAQTQDQDPSPVEYQFSVDGLIKQTWSGLSSYNWAALAGKHTIKTEVRDAGGSDSRQAEVFVFRKPVSPPE
jgi:hypothetical protein